MDALASVAAAVAAVVAVDPVDHAGADGRQRQWQRPVERPASPTDAVAQDAVAVKTG